MIVVSCTKFEAGSDIVQGIQEVSSLSQGTRYATAIAIAQDLESTHVSTNILVQVNLRWCIEHMWSPYDRDSIIIEQGRLHQGILEETMIKIATFIGDPDLRVEFERYRLRWITQPLGSQFLEIVQDFYASYMASFYLVTPTEGRGVDQPSLTYMLVKRIKVDVSEETIR